MATNRVKVKVQDVLLDLSNPRIQPAGSEAEAIAQLLAKHQVLELARDIADRGLSRLETFGFMASKMPGKLIVVEGNRRCCALKLILDPSRAPAAFRDEFLLLKKKAGVSLPKILEGARFDSEEEAVEWKANRHEGQQDGRGLKPWSAEAKNRNAAKGGNKFYARVALQLRDYGVEHGLISREEAQVIAPSTITRYLNTPAVRTALGILAGGQLEFDKDRTAAQRNALAQTFLRDALPTIDSEGRKIDAKLSSRSKSGDRNQYAIELQTRSPQSTVCAVSGEDAVSVPAERSKMVLADRSKGIVPSSFSVKIPRKHKALLGLMKELKEINPNDFPHSSAYLIRAVVELTTKEYAKRHGLARTGDEKPAALMSAAADHIVKSASADPAESKRRERLMKAYRTAASNKDAAHSLDSLGHAVHGGMAYTLKDLKAAFHNHQPALELLIAGLD